ncbi:MAG: ATP-binding protein [Bacteroidetes bacterium]|jgi:predicted kinase|nr:ATP-binding protein [Bacteroidota bacterium]
MEQQSSLIILRGLPGSGKSTLAAVLSENGKYPVTSIDSYFVNAETGEYFFDHTKNYLAYKRCEEQTTAHARAQTEKILVDNAFTLEWELEPYFRIAAEYGYRIFVVTVERRHNGKNVHNVSEEQLKKMAEKYKVFLM